MKKNKQTHKHTARCGNASVNGTDDGACGGESDRYNYISNTKRCGW